MKLSGVIIIDATIEITEPIEITETGFLEHCTIQASDPTSCILNIPDPKWANHINNCVFMGQVGIKEWKLVRV